MILIKGVNYSLTSLNNRAVIFKRNISIGTVEDLIIKHLFGEDVIEENCWLVMEISDYYTPTYNFLLSLSNNCAELEEWKS